MTLGVPAAKVNQLYNELIHLPYDQEQRIEQIGWQLRSLMRQQPRDIPVRVALVYALAMAGKAEEARDLAQGLWQFRHAMDAEVQRTYAKSLVDLGLYELAPDLRDRFAAEDAGVLERHIAVGLGNAAFFSVLAEHVPVGLKTLFLALAKCPDYFQARQAAVRAVVAGRQVAYQTIPVPADDDGWDAELDVSIYVAGDFRERRLLEDQIDDAVAAVSAEFGLPFDALPIVESVYDIRAHGGVRPV